MNTNLRLPDTWAQHPDRACHDIDLDVFYPVESIGPSVDTAKSICNLCPVRADCLDHALRFELHGVWGGTSERQRIHMRRAAGITLTDFHHRDDHQEPAA